ncbi:MAG: hypothetical protein EHM33_00770 [Chloroflexi bacterium]|nr:MAG: hypothetical protein EHM33_00770 [Chloroflexota bacterium]
MKETKDENQLDGLTAEAQGGTGSLPVMSDGKEPPDMLLALLNNVLPSMINSQQAKILGTGRFDGAVGTLIIVYGVQPTSNNLLAISEG